MLLVLVGGACGGGTADTSTTTGSTASSGTTVVASTTTTAPEGFTVTSEDGDLTIEVPFEAMATDPGITIGVLAPEEYPPELAGAAQNPGTVIYSMQPDGLVFDAPVRVTRRIPVANFPGLPEGAIPIVTLVTTTADGSGFEYLGDLEVLLDGDDLFVSGETTHFTPLVAVSEQTHLTLEVGSSHLGFATEALTRLPVRARFSATDALLLSPPQVTGAGSTDDDAAIGFEEGSGTLTVDCLALGQYRPRMGFLFTFRLTDAAEGEATLSSSRILVPGVDQVQVLAQRVTPLSCVDPSTSLAGVGIDLRAQTDHRNGVSDGLIGLGPMPRLDGTWAGLILDLNGNGMVDLSDRMYPVYEVVEMQQRWGYLAPLYEYGRYFIYVVDGNQYDWTPGDDYGPAPVLDHLPVLQSLFRGPGRFEASIALVGVDGAPFVYEVGPEEDTQTEPDAELLLFVVPLIVSSE
ncbi:MAG: hypothetical protein WEE36_00065 [Acidimicrobiia bacterium]